MFCEKCGKEVNDGQRYCAECDKYENSSKVQGILSIVLAGASIVGVLPLIGAIVGIVFGVLSRHTKGEKLGQAGIIVGIISVVIAAVNYIGSTILCVMILIFYIFVAIAALGYGY